MITIAEILIIPVIIHTKISPSAQGSVIEKTRVIAEMARVKMKRYGRYNFLNRILVNSPIKANIIKLAGTPTAKLNNGFP